MLLRAKPVVNYLDLRNKFGVSQINLTELTCTDSRGKKSSCFSYKFTINRDVKGQGLKFVGKNTINFSRMIITISIDPNYPSMIDARAYFDESRTSVLKKVIEPSTNQVETIEGKIFMNQDINDKLSPLTIKFSYDSNITDNISGHTFCPYCAVYSKLTDYKLYDVPFATGCGGKTCESILRHDIVVSRTLPRSINNGQSHVSLEDIEPVNELSSGNETMLIFTSLITNNGESSYNTRMTVSISPMSRSNIFLTDKNCSNDKVQEYKLNHTLVFECDIGNPLDTSSFLSIQFKVEKLDPKFKQIIFNVSLSSSSDLSPESELSSRTVLNIRKFASINVDGQVHYSSHTFHN